MYKWLRVFEVNVQGIIGFTFFWGMMGMGAGGEFLLGYALKMAIITIVIINLVALSLALNETTK